MRFPLTLALTIAATAALGTSIPGLSVTDGDTIRIGDERIRQGLVDIHRSRHMLHSSWLRQRFWIS